jgi:hypothetical protein
VALQILALAADSIDPAPTPSTQNCRENKTNMFGLLMVPFLVTQALAFATPRVVARDNSVTIASLEKNLTSTSGSGNVAATGSLTPFGNIGIGKCLVFILCPYD